MAHLDLSEKKAFRSTPKEWLKLGAQIADLANEWSGRTDLLAYIGKDGGGGMAAACYIPATAEIELNTERAFTEGVKPHMVGDMTLRSVQYDNAKAAGAIWHEAQHARYTTYSLKDEYEHFEKKPGAHRAFTNLEESRIEALGLKRQPQNRAFMRACALEMVIGDQDEVRALGISPTRQMAHLAALTKARVDAGVLEESDITKISAQIDAVLPATLQDDMRSIWTAFQKVDRPDTQRGLNRMYDLAEKWDRLIEDAAKEAGEPSQQDVEDAIREAMKNGGGAGGDGDPSDEEGSGSGSIIDILIDDAEGAAIDAQDEADAQQAKERAAEQITNAQAKASERADHKAASQRVFNKGTGPGGSATNSRLIKKRPATGAERKAAYKVAEELDRAKYRDRDRVVSRSVLPPGRLRSRAMIEAAVLRERGSAELPELFKRVQHKQTEEPTLTIGVMCDISGSMGSAMEPMAVAAWVMSEAAKRIQATIAMVYYGNDVFPTLKPGQHLDQVNVYSAADGTEKFDRAFKALNGATNLLDGRGARLLVVVSDGHYVVEERKHAQNWLYRCRDAGVGVLWIGVNGSYGGDAAAEYCKKADGSYIQVGHNVTDAALKIGQAGADALTRVGNRR